MTLGYVIRTKNHVPCIWLGSLVVRALDLRLDGREFDSLPPHAANTGWVTVLGRRDHLCISPSYSGQLSLLPSAGREMSTGPKCGDAVRLGSKGRMAHSVCG